MITCFTETVTELAPETGLSQFPGHVRRSWKNPRMVAERILDSMGYLLHLATRWQLPSQGDTAISQVWPDCCQLHLQGLLHQLRVCVCVENFVLFDERLELPDKESVSQLKDQLDPIEYVPTCCQGCKSI